MAAAAAAATEHANYRGKGLPDGRIWMQRLASMNVACLLISITPDVLCLAEQCTDGRG